MASKDIKVRAVFEDQLSGPMAKAGKNATSGLTSALQGAAGGVKGLGGGISSLTGSLGGLASAAGPAALALGAAAGVAGAAKLAGEAMAAATRQALDFQAGMQGVASLQIGAINSQLDGISQSTLRMASSMGINAVDATTALYDALSAGQEPATVMQFLETASQAAVGGMTDLSSAGTALSVVMNSYGSSVGSAQQVSDVLFATVNQGVTTFPQLSSSIGGVAGVASATGVSFTDLSASLAQITTKGVSTSQAVTQLKALFTEFSKPSETLKAALEGAGIASVQATLETEGLGAVIGALAQHAEATGTPLNALFGGVEAGSAALSLAAGGGAELAGKLEAVEGASGATTAAMETVNDSASRQSEIMKSQLLGSLTEVALAALDRVTPALTTVNEWLGTWLPAATDMAVASVDWLAGIFGWLSNVVGIVVSELIGFWSDYFGWYVTFVKAYVTLIVLIVKVGWSLLKAYWKIILAFAKVWWQGFRAVAKLVGSFLKGLVKDSAKGAGSFLGGWRQAALSFLTIMANAMDGMGRVVKHGFEQVMRFVNDFLAFLPEPVRAAIGSFGDGLVGAFESSATAIRSARREIRNAFLEAESAFDELGSLDLEGMQEPIMEGVSAATEAGIDEGIAAGGAAAAGPGGGAGSAGRQAGSQAGRAAGEGAKESLMADLAKKFAEAWSAGIKAIADIMGADLPALETLQPKLAIIESFFVDLGLRIQAAARVLDPKDDGSGLKTITDAVPAIKGAVEAFKAAADLARSLVDMVEVNTAALDSLVPLLESARDHAVKMATLNEAQAEAVKRFADTMKPVIEALSAAAQLDLGTVTRLTQEQLDTARMNMADAFVHVMNLSAAFRALSVTAQEDLVQSSARFSAAVGEVVKTIAAAAKVNLAGVTRVMSEELDTVRLNIVDMWMTVAHVSAAFRQLVADAQDNLVAGFARFAEAVGAIGKTVAAVGALNLEGVTRFAADQMETIRLNILDMWMSFAHLSAAFRALSPQQQSDIVDGFARFGEAVKAITGTLKAILEIPPPAGMEGQGATGGDGSYVLRRSAFGWTMSIVEGVVSQSKMLISMLDRAIGAWDGAVNPRVKLLADAVGNVTGLIKNLLELPAKAADFKATEAVGGDGAVLLRRTALGWTADMIEGMVGVAILLVDMVDRAIGQWEREVNPRVKALSDAVSGVTDLIANLVELPVPPEMARAGGSFLVVQWTQDVINHLVSQATLLIAMLDAAIGQWEQNVDSKIGELAGVVGDTLDLLDGIVNMPPPPEMAMAGGSFLVAEWSEALVHHLIDQAKRMVKIVRDAVGAWDDGVSQAVKDLAEATGDAMTLLQAAFDIGEMGLDGIAEVSDHAIETAARQIRKVVEGLGSLIGDAEGQVSSDLVAKAKELGEAFQPVAAALSGVGEMIMAIMSNPFYSASRRVAGARTSAEFAAVVSKDRLSKRIADAIRMMIQTVLDAVAGVTIDPKLGERFQPLVDAAERIRSAFDTLSGLTLPADLDKIIEAARKLAGFGSGGGGGLGTMRWADLEYFGGGGGGGGVSVSRWADLEYFGGAGSGVSPMRWADLEYFGGGGGFSPMRWADLEYFGAGGAATTGMQPGAPITLTGPVTFQGSQTVEVSISGETIQRTAASGTFDQARNRRAQTAPTA